ncbi:unnamed protein product [Lactuca saligna]|uniref:Uncharacterized protein n=1 Tax=Lactuca saligna TaxID=75948 RepID=A0AA36EKL5_LACSI|nr:unnamed protein product [Lactuca saligna]
MFARDLVKFGYNEWMLTLEIINNHICVHYQEVKLAIQQLLNEVKKLNLVPSAGLSICFQRTNYLLSAPTEHLFHLLFERLGHYNIERVYHVLISVELNRRLDELKLDQFRWVNTEILKEVDRFYNGSSDDFVEEG